MSGLVLKLRPSERILVNGVVLENGDRWTKLNIITPEAHVLRLRDAIHPDDANTPVKRVCYIAQMLIAGEADPDEGRQQLLSGISQLGQVFRDRESVDTLTNAKDRVDANKYYAALKALRTLMVREEELMENIQ